MNPKNIITLLKDKDIKNVVGITIKIDFTGEYIRIDYLDRENKLKNKKFYTRND